MEHALKNIKDLEVINGKFVIKGQPEVSADLQAIIDKAPKPTDVSADDFLTKYQDFRDARYELSQRAKDSPTAMERKQARLAYNESKPIEDTVKKALYEGLGEHRPEFERINKGYSEQIYPLRANSVMKKALKGKLGPNTIEDLIGNGEGQELMRDLIKQDPELLRNILGQRYASKPEALHNIDEATAEYLYEMPELKKIIDEQKKIVSDKLIAVAKAKETKNISLQRKVAFETEAKELRKRLDRIEKDKASIWKWGKRGTYTGASLILGAPVIGKAISNITENK
jgi:hypothetical protein